MNGAQNFENADQRSQRQANTRLSWRYAAYAHTIGTSALGSAQYTQSVHSHTVRSAERYRANTNPSNSHRTGHDHAVLSIQGVSACVTDHTGLAVTTVGLRKQRSGSSSSAGKRTSSASNASGCPLAIARVSGV